MTIDEAIALARVRVEEVMNEAADRLDIDLRDRGFDPTDVVAEARKELPAHLDEVMSQVERWLRHSDVQGGVN